MAIGMGEPKERIRAMMIEACRETRFIIVVAADERYRKWYSLLESRLRYGLILIAHLF